MPCTTLSTPQVVIAAAARQGVARSSSSIAGRPVVAIPRHVVTKASRRSPLTVAQASSADDAPAMARRDLLLAALATPAVLAMPQPALAVDFATFYGAAYPPATYGTKGDTTPDDSKYRFNYPDTWQKQTINKIEKGTRGIDSRIKASDFVRSKQQAYVVTLDRAGEDAKSFMLKDPEVTLSSIVAADFDLQDVIAVADEIKTNKRESGKGQTYYEYEVLAFSKNILASITVDKGRLFALFIESTPEAYEKDEATLKDMLTSFESTNF